MRDQQLPHAKPSPPRRALAWLAGAVLLLHLALLASLSGALDWQLSPPEATRVSPLQTRMITPPAPVLARAAPPKATPVTRPRTRVATEPTDRPNPIRTPAPEAEPPVANEVVTEVTTSAPADPVPAPPASVEAPAPAPAPAPEQAATAASPASEATATVAAASESLPLIPLGALPPPTLLSYRLTGQEKGLTYHASGELRWQHNAANYAMALSVKAFLVGSRHWRSVGSITAGGLAPQRFSDSWRSERAAHFDRAKQRVVFSGNAPVAELQPGAQDQISLYVQLAAAMAGDAQRFTPGTRLQIQTITVRDALPWLLMQEAGETLSVEGQAVQTAKWVCHPRNRFDAQVEFWVAEKYNWLPVRIRITQVSGSFIDLVLTGQEPLPALPTPEKPPQS